MTSITPIRPKPKPCKACGIPLSDFWRTDESEDLCRNCVKWDRKGRAIEEAKRNGDDAA